MSPQIFTRKFWRATETPRWALVVGAISTIVLTVFLNSIGTLYTDSAKLANDNRASQVKVLLDDLARYQDVVAAFADEMITHKRASPDTRAALIKNLNDQFSRSREIETLIPNDQPELERLRQSIVKLRDSIPSDEADHQSMTKFWTAVGSLTAIRNKLNGELQRST